MSPELKALTKDRSCCMTCPNDVNQVLPAPDAFPSPRHVPKFPSPNRMARMWSNGVSWSDGGQPRWTLGWLMRLSSLKPWLSPLSIIIHSSLALKFALLWACYLVHGLWTNSFSQLSYSRSLDEFVLSVCNAVGVARSPALKVKYVNLSLWVPVFSVLWCFMFLRALGMTLSVFQGGFRAIWGNLNRLAMLWRRSWVRIANRINWRVCGYIAGGEGPICCWILL
jgi:hypothetical protein